jgi:hypothetical protein
LLCRVTSRALLAIVAVAAGACIESNPQPSPQGDGAKDTAVAMPDATVDTSTPADSWVAPDAPNVEDVSGEALQADLPCPADGVFPPETCAQDLAGDTGPADATDTVSPPDFLGDAPVPDTGDAGPTADLSGDAPDAAALLPLSPTCVDVPFLVAAGQPFPVTVFSPEGCGDYDHVETYVEGDKVQATIWMKQMPGPCPPCIFYTLGVVWLDGLPPGGYWVKVGDQPAQYLVSSAGDIPEMECMEGCPTPPGDGWSVSFVGQDVGMQTSCSYQNQSTALVFEGQCQDYTVGSVDGQPLPDFPVPELFTTLCTETDVVFGFTGPELDLTATRCKDPWGPGAPVKEMILMTALKDATAFTVILEKGE